MITVLLAEDHQIVREGISLVLKHEPDVSVVAETDNGRDALLKTTELSPDVVLMDMTMPDMNGIEATRRITSTVENAKVLILSMHSDKRFVEQALQAGAKGYLLKGCSSRDLLDAIREVAAGKMYFSPQIMEIIVNNFTKRLPGEAAAVGANLTPREREVLQLVAEGHNTKEIAFILKVNFKTVETYRQQIMKKLNLFTVAEITKYAIREGMTSLDA
jgi:DNA-binding NarL/FixJ family response regulator